MKSLIIEKKKKGYELEEGARSHVERSKGTKLSYFLTCVRSTMFDCSG